MKVRLYAEVLEDLRFFKITELSPETLLVDRLMDVVVTPEVSLDLYLTESRYSLATGEYFVYCNLVDFEPGDPDRLQEVVEGFRSNAEWTEEF